MKRVMGSLDSYPTGISRRLAGRLAALSAFALALGGLALGASGAFGHANATKTVPITELLPEPGALGLPIDEKKCVYDVEDRFQKRFYEVEGWKPPEYERYPGACERLTFAHPVLVKPGQNDVLVEPITIGKPLRDGYMTRFRPDLVAAEEIPPVEDIHLHHGTWLQVVDSYGGTVPFLASGEEKTIGQFPRGYGMPIKATDTWQLLYMVHSALPDPTVVWIIYEIDFVPKAAGDAMGMKPAYPLWLDVRPSGYPVFNVMRSFGGNNNRCTWPLRQCASFNPWGKPEVGQGMPGNGKGTDLQLASPGESQGRMRNFSGGTIIGLGGHVHPGGLTTQVDLVREKGGKDRSTRIFTSEANYWNHRNHHKANGPPTSWDMSMTVTGLPYWGVQVKPDDILRINATYDTKHAATWENMGIVIGAITPNDSSGKPQAPGVDPFKVRHIKNFRRCVREAGGWKNIGEAAGIQGKNRFLCEEGVPTHSSYPQNQNHTGPRGEWPAAPDGPLTKNVNIAAFQYIPGDLARIRAGDPVPRVKLGSNLSFTNLEGPAVFHTVTTCKFPCLGPTSASFPISDGKTSRSRKLDLDSGQLGIGLPGITGTKQTLTWTEKVSAENGYKSGEIVTYYCRVHPDMRGAFKVVE
jgi:hypothetical protein